MKRSITSIFVLAAALAWAAFFATPAMAAGATVKVFECASSCTAVGSGSPVDGTIQIQGSGTGSTWGWKSVEVDVTKSGSLCLGVRNSSSITVNWDTRTFPTSTPSGCSSSALYGASTGNTTYTVKVTAHESFTGNLYTATFNIVTNNAPSAPLWAADPSVSGTSSRQPVVTLKWSQSPEPDVSEYHVTRTNPNGTQTQFAVDANDPSQQGCAASNGAMTCYDTSFPSNGFGGTYTYSVASYRPGSSGSTTCYFGGGSCISSEDSSVKQVSMTEPPASSPSSSPSTTPTKSSGPSGGASGSGITPVGVPSTSSRDQQQPTHVLGQSFDPADCFTCGTYKKTLPYGTNPGYSTVPGAAAQNSEIAASPLGETSPRDPRQLWVSMAAGMVLLLTAAHVARVLRATSH